MFEEEVTSGEEKLGKIIESMESSRLGRSGSIDCLIHSFIYSLYCVTYSPRIVDLIHI